MTGFSGRLRKLDIFKKVPTDLSQGTNTGGIISICTALLILYFLCYEFYTYWNPQMVAVITQDQLITRNEMKVVLDIQFPKFPCEIISLDLQDVMMSHHPNIGSISKFRLDRQGNYIDNRPFQLLHQSDASNQYHMAQQAFKNGYGCRLKGSFTVKEVPGNFHISSHAYGSIFTRLFMQGVIKTLDVSHIIHELYWGELSNLQKIQAKHPQAVLHQLKGHKVIYDMTEHHSYTSHYHIDIVPTIYHDGYFYNSHAYQYTYNHNTYQVQHMPSLYFKYHIGGLIVAVYPSNSGLLPFMVTLCAIIGGTYAIANFIDNFVHRIIGRKHEYKLIQ